MRLFGIERDVDADGMLLRTFECPHCRSLQTTKVPMPSFPNGVANPIARVAAGEAFDDDALSLLGHVFDTACRIVESSGAPLAEDARERLAKLIITQALSGERDETRIVERALGSFSPGRKRPGFANRKSAA
jgi:hypothetical protein